MHQFTIGEISEMFKLPPSTLRYYEEIGILTNIARSASGQRIFTDSHINRLRTICCFKNTGMTIAQLKTFFSYEDEESEHIGDILSLLNEQKESIIGQINQLQDDYAHVLRKLYYYGDIKKSLNNNQPLPKWKNYKYKSYSELSVKGKQIFK